jgi:hypothetical protein
MRASQTDNGRGRDEDCSSPPAQIAACAANAPGSSLGFWRRSDAAVEGVISVLAGGGSGKSKSLKRAAFAVFMAPLRKIRWYVYGKWPFAGPEAVLTYLSRYTHRVAIANSRLIAFNKALSASSTRTIGSKAPIANGGSP